MFRMNNCVLVVNFIVIFALRNSMKVYGSGVFEVRIEEFKNEGGRDGQEKCCSDTSAKHEEACSHQCRTAFHVCFSHHNSLTGCTFGTARTAILGGNSFEFDEDALYADNTVKIGFNFTWPGSFSMVIQAYHDVGPKTVGQSIVSMDKSDPMIKPGSGWRTETQSQQGRLLRFSYRVMCDKYNYGSGCAKFCKSRNDRFGHWECNENGDKVCLGGWESASEAAKNYCLKPICRVGCSASHGYCKQPGECVCRYGWQGSLCNECVREPRCRHGTCNKEFQCLCNQGWGGMFCNHDLNFCVNHKPCRNGARCRNSGLGSFTCECLPGFTGKRCEYSTKVCNSSPCKNGGKCVATTSGYKCVCINGHSGSMCEILGCASNPCKNGGSCVPQNNGYQCRCQTGFVGQFCEERKMTCSQVVDCLNGGTCEATLDKVKCVCPTGYTGTYCEHIVPSCTKDCQYGKCVMRNGASTCECREGYFGDTCQFVDPCVRKPCLNEGVCKMEHNDRYSCVCMKGYSGLHCEYRKTKATAQNTNIIVYPNKNNGMSNTQSMTVGFLSVLIVVLIIGLVVCLTYPAKKRAGYFRGMIKKRNSTPTVSSEAGVPQSDSESSHSEEPGADNASLNIDVRPINVQYRNERSHEECYRVSMPSEERCTVRYDTSLPSYQEACGVAKFKPRLV